jgi:hypothetical protein
VIHKVTRGISRKATPRTDKQATVWSIADFCEWILTRPVTATLPLGWGQRWITTSNLVVLLDLSLDRLFGVGQVSHCGELASGNPPPQHTHQTKDTRSANFTPPTHTLVSWNTWPSHSFGLNLSPSLTQRVYLFPTNFSFYRHSLSNPCLSLPSSWH